VIYHVINLDRSPERWAFMAGMCAERGVEALRVPAVDARGFAPGEAERLAPAVPGLRRLAASEVACFESHKRAWAAIAGGAAEAGVVLEDDVWLSGGVPAFCEGVRAAHPALDLVKLNNYAKPVFLYSRPVGVVEGVALHRLAERTIDASAYVMSRECARRALEVFARYGEELDVMLFDPSVGFAAVQAVPALTVQEKFADFDFLPAAAGESLIELTRAEEHARRKAERERVGLGGKAAAEWRRFHRRRIVPRLELVRNLGRPAEARIVQRRVEFVGR
jgi:glycosyl transferase, family 25